MYKTTPIIESNIAEELARVASRLQEQRTGHPPKVVTVVETLLLLECVNVNRQGAMCTENDQLP